MFYNCDVKELKELAAADSWVFTSQVMGFNITEECRCKADFDIGKCIIYKLLFCVKLWIYF